jgi:release factor glutamine methyltransferase
LNISDLKSNFIKELTGLYPSDEIESFFNILSEKYLNLSRIDIALNRNEVISKANIVKFDDILDRLKTFEPIQYIIGETEFFGLPFKVNSHTLIPRPETEELVQLILDEVLQWKYKPEVLEVLDIGTGSGCIAISLANNLPKAEVSALDISREALMVAEINAKKNQVFLNLFECDIRNSQSLPRNYDIIVSNPPYVRDLEKEFMEANVLSYEPELALFVEDTDPLLFYRKIAALAKVNLKPNGALFFEINEYLGKDMASLLKDMGFQHIEIKKDIYGKDRMLKCNI